MAKAGTVGIIFPAVTLHMCEMTPRLAPEGLDSSREAVHSRSRRGARNLLVGPGSS
jgi:hypothetical protein